MQDIPVAYELQQCIYSYLFYSQIQRFLLKILFLATSFAS
jgi:hypothetical protein